MEWYVIVYNGQYPYANACTAEIIRRYNHKVHIFIAMTTGARLVCAHRPTAFYSGPKDQVN